MIRAVFFDAAGTLFDSREPVGHIYARTAREFGLDASDEAVAAGFRRSFAGSGGLAFGPGHPPAELRRLERDWWRRLVARSFEGLGSFTDFDAFFDRLFAHFADPVNWVVDAEAKPLLSRLKQQGMAVGVVSNFDHRVYRILDGLGLANLFDSITISSEAGYAKPGRELFMTALARHGLTAKEAIHVGDSEQLDVAGATAVGMAAILIDREYPARKSAQGEDLTSDLPVRISSLAQVLGLTQKLQSA